jgi:hypothetical protein
VNDNNFGSGASLVNPTGTRGYAPVNVLQSLGISQARYVNIGTAYSLSADKVGTAIGGSAAAVFRVSCAANASVWQPASIHIRASACDSDATTHTSAWWEYKLRVLGNDTTIGEAVEDSGGTTGSYTVAFANVSTSATEVVFDVTVTATNADRCVANLSCVAFGGINSIV